MEKQKRPGVGLAVILMNSEKNEVLLGKRINSHGDGTWAFPGGHLEKFECFAACLVREMLEETGLFSGINYKLIDKNPNAITNDFFHKEDKHYITLYFRAKYINGEPKIREEESTKCAELKWHEWGKFPDNLFVPVKNLLKQNYNPFK